MPIFKTPHYGVCYFPEHWHPSRHPDDIARIADSGFDVVRMAEGAWAYFEPEEGQFRFDLFDRVIELCDKHRLRVIMGTPTYAAPAWVSHKYPEILRWNFQRIPMKHGSRRNYNYTSNTYLDLSDRICTALADHYKRTRPIIGWQLDNEFNCHMDVSYAPSDTLAFRQWLRAKYKTLDRLNAAWGTAFWSQTYSDWDQLDLPHPTATFHNPSQLLDESRFISDTVVRFAQRQAQILRDANSRWLITHNGLFSNVDGPQLARTLDFFSHDQYPLFHAPGDWTGYSSGLRQARSLSFPFAIMEQQSGPGGQMQYLQRTPRPGQMRLWALQSIAHGAKTLIYFRWRTCPYGAEQHWHGLLDADDRNNRRLAEAKQTGIDLKRLPAAFFDAPLARAAAVLRQFDSEVNDARINTYTGSGRWAFTRWAAAFSQAHIPCDYVWPDSDLAGYKLLVLPHTKIIDKALAAKLSAFVTAGGAVVIGAQTGSKDTNCHIVEQPLPGLLRKLAGIEIEDWTTLPEGASISATLSDGRTLALSTFVERLRPRAARIAATWTTDDALLAGAPAVTINRVGKGQVIYIGGYLQPEPTRAMAEHLIHHLGLKPLAQAPATVEIIERRAGKQRFLVLLNHDRQPHDVKDLPAARDLLTNKPIKTPLTLPPHAVTFLAIKT